MTALKTRTRCVILAATMLASCSLVPKSAPNTTLLLPMTTEGALWPANLALGRVQAVSALRTEPVLVVAGARLLQASGMRWAATPAELVGEALARSRAAVAEPSQAHRKSAQLDVTIDAFQWQESDASVLVAMHAVIRCADDTSISLRAASAAVPLPSLQDADRLATAFADASATVVVDLLKQANVQQCTEHLSENMAEE